MRTSESMKIIIANPRLHLEWLKATKGSDKVSECRNGKLWIYHNVKKGVDSYEIWNLNDKVIKRGVSK
jgi:hypothetical protein